MPTDSRASRHPKRLSGLPGLPPILQGQGQVKCSESMAVEVGKNDIFCRFHRTLRNGGGDLSCIYCLISPF